MSLLNLNFKKAVDFILHALSSCLSICLSLSPAMFCE